MARKPVSWAYGVTSVRERLGTLLEPTLVSLSLAGFPTPRLFVDGCKETEVPLELLDRFDGMLTCRNPKILPYGNWLLALAELYIRNPTADRFAIFQDDLLAPKNLRVYLERFNPDHGYLNLYTNAINYNDLKERKLGDGWHISNQRGQGALGLVFNRAGVMLLLSGQKAAVHLVGRPQDPKRGWRSLDGGVVTALNKEGWKEHIHSPSLLLHTGIKSAMDKRAKSTGKDERYPIHVWGTNTKEWVGEDCDMAEFKS